MIIGCCGAGKSTLSKQLSNKIRVPVYHLDQYYWKEGWTETPKEEWIPIVTKLASNDEWIIDGNYGSTIPIRLQQADTIIYLKYSTWKCLYRVCSRIVKYKGKVRPDMPKGCEERWDLNFLHYVLTYNLIRAKKHLALVENTKGHKEVFVLKNDAEVASFLQSLN